MAPTLASSDRAAIGWVRDRLEQKRDHHVDTGTGTSLVWTRPAPSPAKRE